MLPTGYRRGTCTYPCRGCHPAAVRRARRYAAVTALLGLAVAGATPFLAGHVPTHRAAPRTPDPAAVEITHLSAHVVVYSAPSRSGRGTRNRHSGNGARHGGTTTSASPDTTTSTASGGAEGAPVGPTTQIPAEETPTAGGGAPAAMLVQVQCPGQMPAGSLCFEATAVNGGAATFPAPTSLPTLPVVSSPGLPAPCSSTPHPTEDQSAGSSQHRGGMRTGTHSHSARPTEDAADVSAGVENPTGSGSAASCGLLGQSPTDAVGTGPSNGLSAVEARSGEKIELTGYSFQDNQGGNNATISCPQIHQKAGGTGTYDDPITVASGGKSGGASGDGVKCGDRFYLPSVQRYVIVEDTGNTPNKSMPHLDMWVADDPGSQCMDKMSGTVTAIPNPPPGLPVLAGPIGQGGHCLLPGGRS